jgi:acyl carrier protein
MSDRTQNDESGAQPPTEWQPAPRARTSSPDAAAIESWIVHQLAERLSVDGREIDPTMPFGVHGLDSAETVGLTGDLERWLGRSLRTSLAYEYPTIRSLAAYLAGDADRRPDRRHRDGRRRHARLEGRDASRNGEET